MPERSPSLPDAPFRITALHGVLGCLGLFGLLFCGCIGCCLVLGPFVGTPQLTSTEETKEPQATVQAVPNGRAPAPRTVARKWYQGGTLHAKNAIAWQNASSTDKLATCGDILTKCWVDGKLKPKIKAGITSVEDIRPLAQVLATQMEDAFAKNSDPDTNAMLFENQKVSGHALILLVLMD